MIICLHWCEENCDVVDSNRPSHPPVLQNLLEASHSERGFQGRWLMLKAYQCSRGIWLTPTVIGFNFWSALKRSGLCIFQQNYSTLLYSTLLCNLVATTAI